MDESALKTCSAETSAAVSYRDNAEHLAHELEKLDLVIRKRILLLKQEEAETRKITCDPKCFVSMGEVEALLVEKISGAVPLEWATLHEKIDELQKDIDARVAVSRESDVFLALPRLAGLFGLSDFEINVVLICLAPELRRKYDKIYVYLQDDIARQRPSVEMVSDLLCESEAMKWKARRFFSPRGALLRMGILQVVEDPHPVSGGSDLGRFLKLDPRIFSYILGYNHLDERLSVTGAAELIDSPLALEDVVMDDALKSRVLNITLGHLRVGEAAGRDHGKPLVFHFHGSPGVGKYDLARGICSELDVFLLYIDMDLLAAAGFDSRALLRLAFREALLLQVVIYIDNTDFLFSSHGQDEPMKKSLLKHIAHAAREFGWIIILAGEEPWPGLPGIFDDTVFYSIGIPVPGTELRERVWAGELGNVYGAHGPGESKTGGQAVEPVKELASAMARQFRLTPGQIRDAVEFSYYHDILGSGGKEKKPNLDHLTSASRQQSNKKLTQLAVKVKTGYAWDDLVLPEDKKTLLKQVCGQLKQRHRVVDQWGFGKKAGYGYGLSILFSGPPGTGKTMAASVMARELQLDLYKIDLSGVVSKYIGETEKNLAKIFHEAETSNGILFFDEADALFGKRSEVSDAHDRYANIETSFLLQKMEDYDGIVIMSTNFRKNLDEAFTRRIRYIVDFPFPAVESRLKIWRGQFPKESPRSDEIDYDYLAKEFPVTGGHIKNIVLDAAYNAAQNGGIIGMEHLLQGLRKEYEKIGKLWQQ